MPRGSVKSKSKLRNDDNYNCGMGGKFKRDYWMFKQEQTERYEGEKLRDKIDQIHYYQKYYGNNLLSAQLSYPNTWDTQLNYRKIQVPPYAK